MRPTELSDGILSKGPSNLKSQHNTVGYHIIYIYITADSTCNYHLYKTTLLGAVRVRTTVGQTNPPASPAGQLDLVAGLQRRKVGSSGGKPWANPRTQQGNVLWICMLHPIRQNCLSWIVLLGFFHGKLTWFTETNATGSIGTLSLRDILSFFKRRQQRTAQMKSAKHGTIHIHLGVTPTKS